MLLSISIRGLAVIKTEVKWFQRSQKQNTRVPTLTPSITMASTTKLMSAEARVMSQNHSEEPRHWFPPFPNLISLLHTLFSAMMCKLLGTRAKTPSETPASDREGAYGPVTASSVRITNNEAEEPLPSLLPAARTTVFSVHSPPAVNHTLLTAPRSHTHVNTANICTWWRFTEGTPSMSDSKFVSLFSFFWGTW